MEDRQIRSYLELLAKREEGRWQHRTHDQPRFIKVRYSGQVPPCSFHIEATATMLLFHAALGFTIWPGCHLAVYRYALRLNEEMSGAKIGLSHDGQLSLMVEWPRSGGDFMSFETAVRTFLAYHRLYYGDIQMVAQSRKLALHLTRQENLQMSAEDVLAIEVLGSPDPTMEEREDGTR